MERIPRPYPTRNGIAIPPQELELPSTRLNTENRYSYNNHHANFTRRAFGRLAVFQTLRDLERHQYRMGVDVHAYLHKIYEPPVMPTPEQALAEVIDAYEQGERLRFGSQDNPEFMPILPNKIKYLTREVRDL